MKVLYRAFQNHHHEYNTHLISKTPRKFKENVFDRTTTDILKKPQTTFSNERTLGDQEYRIRSLLTLDVHLFPKLWQIVRMLLNLFLILVLECDIKLTCLNIIFACLTSIFLSYLIFVSVISVLEIITKIVL